MYNFYCRCENISGGANEWCFIQGTDRCVDYINYLPTINQAQRVTANVYPLEEDDVNDSRIGECRCGD